MEGGIEKTFQKDTDKTDNNLIVFDKYSSNYTKLFEEVCPYYMSIGVTYDQFWNGDFEICQYARKAEKMRRDRINQESWINGIYMFRALLDAAPAFHDFGDGKTLELSYSVTEPFPLTAKDADVQEENRKRQAQEKMLDTLLSITSKHNTAMRNKKESEHKE